MFTPATLRSIMVAATLILLGAEASRAAPLNVYEGIVVAVGKYAVTVDDPRDMTRRDFAVNQSTKIMRNGDLARFRDLQPGDVVKITVRPIGNKLLALNITAMSPQLPAP